MSIVPTARGLTCMSSIMGAQIIVNGSEKATNQLKVECEKLLTDCKEILAPRVGERVEVTSVTSLFKVRLFIVDFFSSLILFLLLKYTS